MKRSSLFILLISLFTSIANACYDTKDLHYYMFSVYHQNALQERNGAQNIKFWKTYSSNKISEEDIARQLENSGSMADDDNRLINYLKTKRDEKAVAYLEQLKVMKKAAQVNKNNWNYPTKAEKENAQKSWTQCMNWAVARLEEKQNILYPRYVLMAMRGAFYSGNKSKMAEIWTKYGPKVKIADIKNQCEGYMANEWIANGLTEKAREFYVKNGNIADLRATLPKVIKLKDMKDLFKKTPNSVAFPYMLQDYLNAMDSDLNSKKGLDQEEAKIYNCRAEKDSATVRELLEFAKFANTVATGDHTTMNSLWMSASGYALYLAGRKQEAEKLYYASLKMKVPQRVAFNTRALILLVRAETATYDDKFTTYVSKEINWLANTAKKEKPFAKYASSYFRNHYTDVMEHVVIDYLVPNYLKMGNTTMAALLCSATDEVTNTQKTYNRRCTLLKRDSTQKGFNGDYSGYLAALLDTISTNSVINLYTTVNGGGTQVEQTILPHCHLDNSYLCDIIGTKMMREFKFKSAMEYLKKVPAEFVSEMNIYPYMAYDFNTPLWFGYGQTVTDKQKKKSAGAKMEFCKQALKLETNFEKLNKKQKPIDPKLASTAYDLAKIYTQASYRGRCWALTNYSWSSMVDSTRAANDPYIKRAKAMLKAAYKVDTTTANQLRCIAGLSFLGGRQNVNGPNGSTVISDSDLDKYMRLLQKFEGTQAYEENRLGRCDILRDYLANQ